MRDDNRKRVLCACDSCRVKKTKCDGNKPCTRCVHDGQLCTFSHRKKQPGRVFTTEYVELLEAKVNVLLSSLTKLVELVGEGNDCREHIDGPNTPINKVIDSLEEARASSGNNRRSKLPRFESPGSPKHESDCSSLNGGLADPHTPACERLPITPPTLSPEEPSDASQSYARITDRHCMHIKSESPYSQESRAPLSVASTPSLSAGPSLSRTTTVQPSIKRQRVHSDEYMPQHTVALGDIELAADEQGPLDEQGSLDIRTSSGAAPKAQTFWEGTQQRRPDGQSMLLEGFEQSEPSFYDILDDAVSEPLESAVDLADLYFHSSTETTCMR